MKNAKTHILSVVFVILCCLLNEQSFAQVANCLCSGGQMNATPFCTDQNPYGLTYAAGTSGYASELYYLNTTGCIDPYDGGYNPAWFKMKISHAGNLTIFLQHTGGGDIDYACWGPFTDADMNNMCANYPNSLSNYLYDNLATDYSSVYYNYYYMDMGMQIFSHHPTYVDYNSLSSTYGSSWTTDWYNPNPSGRLVDCSSTPSPTEWIHIRNAQVGQWYIVFISNWEGVYGNINFTSDASSTAETDCTITAPVTGDEVCEGETATLTAQSSLGAVHYAWTGPNNFSQTTQTNTLTLPNVTVADAGTYSMRIWNGSSYGQTTTCQLIVHPAPNLDIQGTGSVCNGGAATLTATGAETYIWNTGTTTADITVRPLQTTTYTVTGTTGGMCTATASFTVTVSNAYEAEYTDTICQGEVYNQYGFSINANQPGTETYQQSLQSAAGCDSNIILHLTVLPAVVVEQEASICAGESYIFFGNTYTETGSYSEHFPTEDGCDSVITLHLRVNPGYFIEDERTVCETQLPYHYLPADTTFDVGTPEWSDYYFVRSTAAGCDSSISLRLHIVENSFEMTNLTEDFCENHEAVLQVITTLDNLHWNTGETEPVITVTHPGTYIATAYTGQCQQSGQIFIPTCTFYMFLPNAITPSNEDGNNDVFFIPDMIADMISDVEVTIYNRWGRLIYRSTDPHFRWDGTVNGKLLTNTVYTYRITYLDGNDYRRIEKGTVTVL